MIITDSIIETAGAAHGASNPAPPSNDCWELDNATRRRDSINAASAGETTINRTVINCQTPTSRPPINDQRRHADAWIMNTGATPSAFNTNNAVITRPGRGCERQVLQPGTFFSFDDDTTERPSHDHGAAAGAADRARQVPDNYIGAVQSTANWTAGWTYGFDVGNRGIAPWWEQ